MGLDVTLLGGSRGFGIGETQIDGVEAQLFGSLTLGSKARFAAVISPRLIFWLVRNLRKADVVHVHLSRDLVTLPAAVLALLFSKSLVVQPHGMIAPTRKLAARLLDQLVTIRVLRKAATVFYLSRQELDAIGRLTSLERLHMTKLPNGIPSPASALLSAGESGTDVLFLARLNVRKRPDQFVRMAQRLSTVKPGVTFSLVGPDGGMGREVVNMITNFRIHHSTKWEGALAPSETLDRMSLSAIYVLPAVDEPFGMTVLEALSCERPVVVTDTCALAPFIEDHDCGIVTDGSVEQLSQAVCYLLENPLRALEMGKRGAQAVTKAYGMNDVSTILESSYKAIHEPSAAKIPSDIREEESS